MNKQRHFEIENHYRAVKRMEREVQNAKNKAYFSSTEQARASISTWALPLAEQLQEWIDKHNKARASTKVSVVACPEIQEWFKIVDPNVVSVILLKSVFDAHGVHDKLTLPKLAQMIGTRLEDEARFRFYEITAPPEVVKAAWDRVQKAGSTPRYRRLSTKIITEKMLDTLGVDPESKWKPWSDHYRITMGLALVEFLFAQGLITKTLGRSGRKTTNYVDLSPETKAVQDHLFHKMTEMSYLAYPLIEPPLPWVSEIGEARDNTSGGYHTDFIREQLTLCRGRYYKSKFGQKSIDFLNLLGNVPLTLYPPTVDLATQCRDKGYTIGSMINLHRDPRLDLPMPERLTELEKDHPDRKGWRDEMKALHRNHEELRRKSVRSRQAVTMAQEYLQHPTFYLSWSNDYRGRVYSQQPWLNPQTTDMEKSLLAFKEGHKLDDRGELWAAQAVGAAFLGSTKAFADRTIWTLENKELIKAIADDPLGTQGYWSDCKEPWTFIQLALEWNAVVLEREKDLWNVPVGADATASGLQLLSSMLRDPIGMKYANVTPPEDPYAPPQDSYLAVLGLARQMAAQKPETQHLVEHMIHRNIGKVTMVHLYGATHGTIRNRIVDVFMKLKQYGRDKAVTWEMCDQMAHLVANAAKQVFPKAYEALDWLQKLARIAAQNGATDFKWFTPTDDQINLQIFESNTVRINTSHLGKVTIPTGRSKELAMNKMKAAFPPGFIHSYDAALLKTAFNDWKHPLAVIHDCIRVLPNHVDEAHNNIRQAFISVCAGDPLARLADDLKVTEDQLPRLTQGDQNLDAVLDSPYLFN